ncbi:NADH-quinone oxidoreductase subunit L [Arcanobacterium pinnipediorum]|uniref:NADH-quinone oxidoreductase subunit L n=1 Tax=Arcanobacterium pinnipediorum TaxID=1503041 RepID=A0ABY5ALC8_9ACTO|nr:NADH-quinone oxidoreductase subunit L [Arcanobacterium pinnipediorum]USR80206.1 NADH-quinone oxidoreductase subunit L [Arcanobacterium pinnipediorum]
MFNLTAVAQVGQATGAASTVWLAVAIPLISCGILLILGRRADSWGHWLATLASASSFVVGLAATLELLNMDAANRVVETTLYTWVPAGELAVDFGTRTDPLSMTFVLLVTFVGTLIHIYSVSYMEHDSDRRRFFAYLNLFVAAMLLLVLGNSYLVLFFGWEGVGLASYLLISFWNHVPAYATAGKKAFVMNRIGDLGMLIAMMSMVATFGSVAFSDIAARAQTLSPATATFIGIFLLVAACGKSAQFPLQAWLGDAMAGPTPVSALIHAATMVTAGVYLMVRSGVIYAVSPTASLIVSIIGLITLVFGAVVGAAKDDMKKVLAASTMSQIGYMMLAATMGPVGAAFAIFHLLTHGFFKANMFLGAGAVMHAMSDEVNIRGFGGLGRHMKITFVTFLTGYLAIIGFPFLSGYFSKDKIIEVAFSGEGIQPWVFGPITVLVAGLTAFYMSRVFFAIFLGKERWDHDEKHPHDPSPLMWVPMTILALGSLGLGAVLNYTGFLGWLEPAIGQGHHPHPVIPIWAITVLTLAVVAIGVGLAWKMYVVSDMPKLAPQSNALVRAARVDLYQDAFNENLVMKPGIAITAGTEAADQMIVDGGFEGLARGARSSGTLIGKLQTGYVRTYASWITVGVVLALVLAVQSAM